MTNEIVENTEEVVADDVEDAGDGFDDLDEVSQLLMQRQGTKLPAPEEVAEESVEEPVEEPKEEVVEEPEHLFELDDGTKVTLDEAKAGYLRHGSYTQKTQVLADERKKNERYSAIITRMENDPALLRLVTDHMHEQQGKQAEKPQTRQLQVPDNYKGDKFVETTVDVLNELQAELAKVKGGFNNMQKSSTEATQQAEQKALFDARLAEGYEYLKGQVGTPPTPQEYVKRIEDYVKEQGLDPQVVGSYIIGGDPDYLRAKIDGAFKTDIAATNTDKVNSGEKERKKRVAKTQTLRVAGKSKTAVSEPLPKGKDGKPDPQAALLRIMDEQDRLARR